LALAGGYIDALTFTSVRLVSGAVVLTLVLFAKSDRPVIAIDPLATLALIVYALAFSIAYMGLGAGVGALLLFGAVQVTMLSVGMYRGERFSNRAWFGFALAVIGLITYLLPGNQSAPMPAVGSMLIAGCAWGIYSLRGAHGEDPVASTASNFLAAVPITLALAFLFSDGWHITSKGIVLAALSGAGTSGLGYVLWYHVVKRIPAFTAATVQLGVPIFAALGGVVILREPLTMRLAFASITVLGGIALVVKGRQSSVASASASALRHTDPGVREQWIHGAGI
jgi:drug/metabolite transporter (DMT)-like permease